MHFFLVYNGLECIDLKERNRKQKYDQLKRRYSERKNFTAFLKIFFKKF